ncbi:MAG: hypothetical protein QOG72_448 [Sphingomonadales bacterium]|nr:hypothetical protein [Sphingomonadales bacterium]
MTPKEPFPDPVAGGVIRWGPVSCADVAPPVALRNLLERAIAANPDNGLLRARLADLQLDAFDYAAAATSLGAALRLGDDAPRVRLRLARCYNVLRRHEDALGVLAGTGRLAGADYERGVACSGLGRPIEAEAAYRQALSLEPGHHQALWKLSTLLRGSGRSRELLALCEALRAEGVESAQLLFEWGQALALTGAGEQARAFLFDPDRVAELALLLPSGFADMADFNAALAEELLASPSMVGDLPPDEEANRGSSRVHNLFAGRRPDLLRTLLASIEEAVADYAPAPGGGRDPWAQARPGAAHLKAWGLIQSGGDYETWHIHRGGWLSGVYYIQVPSGVAADGTGSGCIEYGPPPSVAEAMPDLVQPRRYAPRPGMLLVAPSHYPHRTIPTGSREHRISFAFDVVPDRGRPDREAPRVRD